MSRMTRIFLAVLLGGVACSALGADKDAVRHRWGVNLGGQFVYDAETIVRLDALNGLIGTTINFNEDLGLESNASTVKLDGYWRFNNHHSIRADWYRVDRSGQRTLEIDINFGDRFFQAGADVNSLFNVEIIDAMYQYSFYNTEKVEFAVQGGLHITTLDVGIDDTNAALSESASVTAPLPVFGFAARYNFFPKLSVNFNWKSLELEVGDFGGNLTEMSLLAEHRTFKRLGFGFGLQRFDMDLEASHDGFSGLFKNRWDGIYLYLMGYSP